MLKDQFKRLNSKLFMFQRWDSDFTLLTSNPLPSQLHYTVIILLPYLFVLLLIIRGNR